MENLQYSKLLTFSASAITLLFLYCGFYAIPSADDYFYANLVREHGLINAQIQHYIDWSGRYSATFLLTLFSLSGFNQYWLVPWACILSLMVSTFFLLTSVFYQQCKKSELAVFSISLTALYLACTTAGPNHGIKVINEGFFWYSGAITYIISLSLYFVLLRFLLSWRVKSGNTFYLSSITVLLVIIIGLNETVMFLVCMTVIPMLWFFRKEYGWGPVLVLSSIITCCAALMVFAPGNSVRMSTSDGGNILSAVGVCFEKLGQIFIFYLINPFIWLFSVVFYSFITRCKVFLTEHYCAKTVLYLGGALFVYLLYFPVAYSLNSGAPDRLVAFVGFFALLISLLYINSLLGLVLKKIPSKRPLVIFLAAASLASSVFMLQPLVICCQTVFSARQFKATHVARAEFILAQKLEGKSVVEVPPIERNSLLLFEDLDPATENTEYAKYYGVRAVKVSEKGN